MPDLKYWDSREVANELTKKGIHVPESNFLGSTFYRQGDVDDALKDFTSIDYVNDFEDVGSTSKIVLDTNSLRSRFAAFNPLKRKSSDLLAGVGASSLLYEDDDEDIWTMTSDGKRH